jgi:hypothetical protein
MRHTINLPQSKGLRISLLDHRAIRQTAAIRLLQQNLLYRLQAHGGPRHDCKVLRQ